jgi:hypothetical protein
MDLDPCAVVFGYFFSVLVGHCLTKFALIQMRTAAPGMGRSPDTPVPHTGAVGLVERTIYTSAFVLGHPEFAAVWLAFKTASVLGSERDAPAFRSRFNRYLVGAGLSLVFGVAGGLFAASANSSDLTANLWPMVIALALWALIVLACRGPGRVQSWLG